ncbi:MAG: hypothetical protein CM15mP98_12160 [Paracoccaceae bacterium]|nr:MAG: hypothetical protein CM15mP98_12160 [Paracoccaceae bacterium]
MPSFGYYTGGLSIKNKEIQKLFGSQHEIFPFAKKRSISFSYRSNTFFEKH